MSGVQISIRSLSGVSVKYIFDESCTLKVGLTLWFIDEIDIVYGFVYRTFTSLDLLVVR